MKIVWDEPKRLANLRNRGLDFADLNPEFFAAALVMPARLGRKLALGMFDGKPIAVIVRPLGKEAISVISMRIASRKERSIL